MSMLNVANRAISALASDISDTDVSLTVTSGEGIRFPSSNFVITVENERILVGSRTDDTFSSLTRHYDDSVAAAHTAGQKVRLNVSAALINSLKTEINTKLGNVLEDTSPQLGGDLDTNSHDILLNDTTNSTTGIIYKGSDRFIHNFHHPTGDSAVPDGLNTFTGVNAGNFTMGSTATATYQGSYNTGIGFSALASNTSGYFNTGVGSKALMSNTTGTFNSAFGPFTLSSNTTGSSNVAIGPETLQSNTTGHENVGVGSVALSTNDSGYFNIGIGTHALKLNKTGFANSAIGHYALCTNDSGHDNTAIGANALGASTGDYDTALGSNALRNSAAAYYNTSIGMDSLYYNSTGSYNSGLGMEVLFDVTTGSANTAIGFASGRGIKTGSNNTIIGANVGGLPSDLSNTVIIADGAGHQRIYVDSSGMIKLNGDLDYNGHGVRIKKHTYTGSVGTTTVDWTKGSKAYFTFGAGNETLAFTAPFSNAGYQENLQLIVKQDSTGGRTLTYPSNVKWENGSAPTLSTAANAIDILTFSYDSDDDAYYGQASLNFS